MNVPRKSPRTPVDLRRDGVLFMINTVLFHPRGFALVLEADGSFSLAGDGQERWTFSEAESADNDRLWRAFQHLLAYCTPD